MQGTKSTKRKIPFHDGELFPSLPISQGLLSPLKSLKLSPIPRNENSRWLGNDDHLLDDKGKIMKHFSLIEGVIKYTTYSNMNDHNKPSQV